MKKRFYKLGAKEAFIKINSITSLGHHDDLGYFIICDGQAYRNLEETEYEKNKKDSGG